MVIQWLQTDVKHPVQKWLANQPTFKVLFSLIMTTPTPSTTSRKSFSIWSGLTWLIIAGVIAATVFTMWSPANLFTASDSSNKPYDPSAGFPADWPTPTTSPRPRIGIVAGHWGNDSGAVCDDTGLTEVEVNLRIATIVQQNLMTAGYDVDLLEEFDERRYLYDALALVSIHNDSCDYINDQATGFKVAASFAAGDTGPSSPNARLQACLVDRYSKATNLPYHPGSITNDMKEYHTFSEINPRTPAAIIETGFLRLDREFLTQHPDLAAKGISDGILCFIQNEPVSTGPTVTP